MVCRSARWCAGVQDGVQESRSSSQCGWDGGNAADDNAAEDGEELMMKTYVCC